MVASFGWEAEPLLSGGAHEAFLRVSIFVASPLWRLGARGSTGREGLWCSGFAQTRPHDLRGLVDACSRRKRAEMPLVSG
jgi:hypothetical protein